MPAGSPVTALFRFERWCSLLFAIALAGLPMLAGCEQDEAIIVENVPKDVSARTDALKPTPPSDRMLAAIVPHNETAYFFKLTGPIDQAATVRPQFLELLRSLRFEGGEPRWNLPSGWTQEQGSPGRIATITVPTEPPLSLAVSSLRLPDDGLEEYMLANINRWRRQMGLAALATENLAQLKESSDEVIQLRLSDGTEATLVDFPGNFSGGMTPPFAVQDAQTPPTRSMSPTSQLSYELPNGWQAAPGDGVSTAAFSVGGLRTTITALSATNDLLSNVNRWRGQVGLMPIDASELDEATEKIQLGDGGTGDYVVISGPMEGESPKSILGVVAVRDDTAWFVKMMGDSQAVLDQQDEFEAFVKSLRFSNDET